MRRELDEALLRDFPYTFAKNPNGREPWSMFGFECGDGWEPSIRKAAEKLEPLIVAALKKYPEAQYGTTQLKEKYGTGSWYFSGDDAMDKIISEWENETERICEGCGREGKLRGRSWLYTACYYHAKEEHRDNLEYLEITYDQKQKENQHGKTQN